MLCLLQSCASLPDDNDQTVEKAYSELFYLENNIVEYRREWEYSKQMQLGQSPETALNHSFRHLADNIDISVAKNSSDGTISNIMRRRYYLRLMKKYGVCLSIVDSKLFSTSELQQLVNTKHYTATTLYWQTMGQQ